MLWQEAEKEKNFLSSSKVVKRWAVEEDQGRFVLEHKPEGNQQEKEAEIIQQAKLEAKAAFEKAYREGYEKGQQSGFQEGYEKGRLAGEAEGLKRTDEAYRQALKVLCSAEKCRRERISELEPDIKKLAVSIAEKIIFAQLAVDEQTIMQITKNALDMMVNPEYINVYVHPKDGDALIKNIKALSEEIVGNVPVKIIKNGELPIGSCYLETDKGTLDASVKTQIMELKHVLEIA